MASALCIVVGALLLATWGASTAALAALEDGTIIEDATARVIATEAAQNVVVEAGTDRVLEALAGVGVSTDIPGMRALVESLIASVVSSQGFADATHAQAAAVRQQVVKQLQDGGTGPITVSLDFSVEVNAALTSLPLVGDSLPSVSVPPVPVEVMDAQTADAARTTWGWLETARAWCGWLGLGFLALGIVVSFRKRWYAAKVALAVAAMSAGAWLVLTWVDASTVATWLPGEGLADAVLVDIADHAKANVASTMGWVALGAMMMAAVLLVLARSGSKGKSS